ncbi:MAG: glycosyl hydrolase family 18 protein [Clostridiales bacterium]|nr:glycosyl hydrolase family 18 protein [Clostridiales bacterium]
MPARKRRKQRKQRRRRIRIAAIVVLAIVIVGIVVTKADTGLKNLFPSSETTDYASFYGLESEEDVLISFDSDVLEETGLLLDGEVYIPYDVLHSDLNARFYWDSTEQILRYTLADGIVNVEAETTEYTVAKESLTADFIIVHIQDGTMYLSLSFIEQYTDLRSDFYEDPNRVVISDVWGETEYTSVKKNTEVRELGGVRSSILTEVSRGDRVTVIEELDDWAEICTEDGFVGYVKKKALGDVQTEVYTSDFVEQEFSHISKNYTINMAWHQVTSQDANAGVSDVLASANGVNVISPTWFYLDDDDGGIASLANSDYVTYCHQQGIEVWALVSNLENTDVDTTKVLSVTSSRDTLVNNLVSEAIKYDLDGINVDFESLEGEAGTGFLQFIRELSLKCRNNDIVLSVDNYAPASYNAFYSRDEQAVFADYIILMAYDEHYSGSEEGSVASLSFVTQAVEDTLEEVPAEQLILGCPFYTRLWKLTPVGDEDGGGGETAAAGDADEEGADESAGDAAKDDEDAGDADADDDTDDTAGDATAEAADGSGETSEDSGTDYTVTSEALSMSEAEARVNANGADYEWLEDCGQYYAEYEYDGSTYKIWLEDQNSIEKKLEVMQSYGLAGASFWKLGFEKNTVWDTIAKFME